MVVRSTATANRRRLVAALGWVGVIATVAPAAGEDPPVELPARRVGLTIDGDLADWKGTGLAVDLAEPGGEPTANRGTAYLLWDTDRLWLGFEVHDDELFAPPAEVPSGALYQWDSIELYLDTGGEGSDRMDENDFQFVWSCDGRAAVYQGDAMLATRAEVTVPKRERLALAVTVAARRQPWGYVVEGAVPLAAIGVAAAAAGRHLRIDVAWNDWTEDHPQLPLIEFTLAHLGVDDVAGLVDLDDPEAVGWQEGQRIEARAYRPWSWSATRDFGYPRSWHRVELVGRPAAPERDDGVGLGVLLLSLGATVVLVGLAVGLPIRRNHRRRVGALIERLEALEATTASEPIALASNRASEADEPPDSGRVDTRATDRAERSTPAVEPGERRESSAGVAGDPTRPSAEVATAALAAASASPVELVDRIERAIESEALPALTHRVLDHIRGHLDQAITVGDLASALGMSQRSLQRGLKETLGHSPHEVVLAVKMAEARRLLCGGDLRVGEVAERVGFESAAHFSRRFKGYFGVPPSALARQPPA